MGTYVPFVSHGHEADGVFWVGVDLCLEDGIDCVGLGIESRRRVVAIPHVLGIVDDHHRRFERHFEGLVVVHGQVARLDDASNINPNLSLLNPNHPKFVTNKSFFLKYLLLSAPGEFPSALESLKSDFY